MSSSRTSPDKQTSTLFNLFELTRRAFEEYHILYIFRSISFVEFTGDSVLEYKKEYIYFVE